MLFSYIIPSYNPTKDILLATIESIYQDCHDYLLTDYEVIIIDDASANDCKVIYEQILDMYDNVKVIFNDKNCGMGETINRGISQSKSRYIFRLDADDLNIPGRTRKQLELFRRTKCAFQATGAIEFEHENPSQTTLVDSYLTETFFVEALNFGLPCHHSSFAFDRHIIKTDLIYCTRDSDFSLIEDFELIMRLKKKGYRFQYCIGPWIQYRKLGGSLSTQRVGELSQQKNNLLKHYQDFLSSTKLLTLLVDILRSGLDRRKIFLCFHKIRRLAKY